MTGGRTKWHLHRKVAAIPWLQALMRRQYPWWRGQMAGFTRHYSDVIMRTMAFQIISITIVYFNRLFRRRSKKTSKLRVTGLCEGNSPMTSGFPAQRASNAEKISIWWRHQGQRGNIPSYHRINGELYENNGCHDRSLGSCLFPMDIDTWTIIADMIALLIFVNPFPFVFIYATLSCESDRLAIRIHQIIWLRYAKGCFHQFAAKLD